MEQSISNFALYEDANEYMGMVKVSMPDLTAITQTINGAGIPGNIETVIKGHYDTMTLGLNFRTTTEQAVKLSELRRHNIDLRVAKQYEDPVSGILGMVAEKHVMVVLPKKLTGGSIAPASPTDASGEYAVRYWATYLDGVLVREIDPFNGKCLINGIDYLAPERAALGK